MKVWLVLQQLVHGVLHTQAMSLLIVLIAMAYAVVAPIMPAIGLGYFMSECRLPGNAGMVVGVACTADGCRPAGTTGQELCL